MYWHKTNSDWMACTLVDVDSYCLVSTNLAQSDITIKSLLVLYITF